MKKETRERMLKIVYAWLLKHGQFTTGEWNYYGGRYEPLKSDINKYDDKQVAAHKDKILKHIKTVGVDWVLTQEPKDEDQSEFTGTFSDPATISSTVGELVLKNGEKYTIATRERTLNLEMVATVLQMADLEDSW